MDPVLTALFSPLFWAGSVFGLLLAAAIGAILIALIGKADEALDRAAHLQRTRNAATWPGTAERDTTGATAPRTRRSDLRSGPR